MPLAAHTTGMKMKKTICLLMLLASAQATATDWKMIGTTPASTGKVASVMYFDPSSVVEDGTYLKFWILKDNLKPITDYEGKKSLSAKVLYAIDCKKRRFGINALYEYSLNMGQGHIVDIITRDAPAFVKDIVPGSMVEYVAGFLCK